jgi:hypothetical protein
MTWSTSGQQNKCVRTLYQGEMHGCKECDNFRAEELRFWEISQFLTVINTDKDATWNYTAMLKGSWNFQNCLSIKYYYLLVTGRLNQRERTGWNKQYLYREWETHKAKIFDLKSLRHKTTWSTSVCMGMYQSSMWGWGDCNHAVQGMVQYLALVATVMNLMVR